MRVGSILSLLACAAGCGQPTPPIGYCSAPRSIAVEITVLDSVSLSPRADSAFGVIQAGSALDSLHRFAESVLYGGTNLGTYQVTIHRPGYRDWSRTNIAVSKQGPCGNTIPVELTARLQHTP